MKHKRRLSVCYCNVNLEESQEENELIADWIGAPRN
jgi:hypothetical protein